jgi:hypothetical protein
VRVKNLTEYSSKVPDMAVAVQSGDIKPPQYFTTKARPSRSEWLAKEDN